MRRRKMMSNKFSFCIGRQWYEFRGNPENICPYTIANRTIMYGDMDDAERYQKYVHINSGNHYPYSIYKLVKI